MQFQISNDDEICMSGGYQSYHRYNFPLDLALRNEDMDQSSLFFYCSTWWTITLRTWVGLTFIWMFRSSCLAQLLCPFCKTLICPSRMWADCGIAKIKVNPTQILEVMVHTVHIRYSLALLLAFVLLKGPQNFSKKGQMKGYFNSNKDIFYPFCKFWSN